MITEARWNKEIEIMRNHFPWFTPFETTTGYIGFCGYLKGPRSKRLYQVLIKIPKRIYPEREPPVYIEPKLTQLWWRMDDVNGRASGRLCYHRKGTSNEIPWQPGTNTFANVLGFAVQYISEFDQ